MKGYLNNAKATGAFAPARAARRGGLLDAVAGRARGGARAARRAARAQRPTGSPRPSSRRIGRRRVAPERRSPLGRGGTRGRGRLRSRRGAGAPRARARAVGQRGGRGRARGRDLAELCSRAAELAVPTGARPARGRARAAGSRAVGDLERVRSALLHARLGRYLVFHSRPDADLAAFERAVELLPAESPSPERRRCWRRWAMR